MAGVLSVVAAAAVGGYLAGSQISSPAELALRTAAPSLSPILVPVERRTLSSDVVTRGTGAFGSPQKLAVASSSLKPSAGILAELAIPGTELSEGAVAASASGRPVFVLVGATPMSRDIGAGSVGDDVAQLEAALVRLGFDPGPVDGVYDDGTAEAVSSWYRASGFAPFDATQEQLAASRARSTEQALAESDRYAASDAVAAAEANLVAARAALDAARSHSAAARRAVASAQAEANSANVLAEAELALKRSALESARSAGSSAPDLLVAQRDVAVSEATRETARLGGVRSIDAAFAAVGDADVEVMSKDAGLAAAEEAVRNGGLALAARSRVEGLAAAEAARASQAVGVQVPADEVVFVASGPIRVSEHLVGVGDVASGGIMRVTDSAVHVDAALAVSDVALVRPGMEVRIEEPDLGISATGTVSMVAASPGTNGVDGFHVYARVDVATPPATLTGASVRLTIPVESTGTDALAVPVSAVTLLADGTSRVRVDRHGEKQFIVVEPKLSAQGYVAVQPVGATLTEGDLVVIGQDNSNRRAAAPSTTRR